MKSISTLIILAIFSITSSAQDSSYRQIIKMLPDMVAEEDFGTAVDITDDWVMIGAEDAIVNGQSSGCVYVYKRSASGLQFIKKIVPSDGSGLNRFGNSISIENETVVIGAHSKGFTYDGTFRPASGKAYIFQKDEGGLDNWGEIKDIHMPDPSSFSSFGFSVDLGGDIIAIGGYRIDDLDNGVDNIGKVYLYERDAGGSNQWGLTKELLLPGAVAEDEFGRFVEVNDSYLAVYSSTPNSQGRVDIFDRNKGGVNNWGHQKTIVSSTPAQSQAFGDELSLDGDRLLIGGLREFNTNFSNAGRAFIHEKDAGGIDNWGLVKTFEPTASGNGQEFGVSVDLQGDYIIVGAEEDDESALNAGAAYIYHRNEGGANNWGLVDKVFACDGDVEDEFGTAVAILDGVAIVGADDDSEVINNAGGAYMHQFIPNQLLVDNVLINNSGAGLYQSGSEISATAQINLSQQTVSLKAPQAIELEALFSVDNTSVLECIIDICN